MADAKQIRDWCHARAPTLRLPCIATTEDALTHDDVSRLQVTARWGAIVALSVAVAIQFIGTDAVAIAVHTGGLLVGLAASLYVVSAVRVPADLRPYHAVGLGLAGALATTTGLYFWGPFSAATIVVPAAAMLLTQSRKSSRGVVWIAVAYQSGHMLVGLLVVTGTIADRALTPIGPHPLATHLGRLALIQLIMTGTFAVAHRIRSQRRHAMAELDEAVRALGRREAMLDEAMRDRDGPGAYTGHVIEGYLLGDVIGRGTSGVVYEAIHERSGESAALKLLHPHVLARPSQYRRFAREVATAASLTSPHLVRVVALPANHQSFPFLAMERLVGRSLADHLADAGPMPIDEVVDLVRQVGAGLRAAHRAGIVHRDLKPSNVFRLDEPVRGVQWKILDFGTSTTTSPRDAEQSITGAGALVGTPAYMAPEQARGGRVDDRADVYALGVIAYRALTGCPPFSAPSLPEILHAVVYETPTPPSRIQPELSPDVDAVFAIALAKQPYARFPTGADLADALGAAARSALSTTVRARAVG